MAKKHDDQNQVHDQNGIETADQQQPVTMVEDPFGIKTLEISDIQNETGELELDEELNDELDGESADQVHAGSAESEVELDDDGNELAELELAEEDPILMSDLAKAVAQSDADHAERVENQIQEGLSSEEAAVELARQIAEDEALAKSLAEQAEEDENDPELLAALPSAENLDVAEIQSCIEALLFMADKPLSGKKLRELLGLNLAPEKSNGEFDEAFHQAIAALQERYKSVHHGFEVMEVAGGYQFRTKQGRAPLARKLAKIQTQRLSSGGMESLAIISYKQPVLKEDIDKIRGVDSSYFIRGLMDKKLIKISGRSELPGRPLLYSTTDEFLQIFGLNDLNALPPLRELESMIPTSQAKHEDDPRVKEMRRLVGQMNTDVSTTLAYDPKEDEKLLQEIRERVQSIPSSTPYLDEQKAMEQAEVAAKKQARAQEKQLAALGELGAAMIADTMEAATPVTAPESNA
jgi:segregation and condensation protein B